MVPRLTDIRAFEMLSDDFAIKLSNFPYLHKNLDGVYSADKIPRKITKNHFFICNTDVSSGPGKHWFCVLKLENNILECFDSLGITDEKKEFLRKHLNLPKIRKIDFNTTSVQSPSTSSCGLFVLYFLVHRFHNKDLSFDDLMNEIFVASVDENEKKVTSFCNFHFP